MNEEALRYSYDLFRKDGYTGSIDDFKSLMSSNPEALNHSYGLFKNDGYNSSVDDFKKLIGVQQAPISVEKKSPSVTTALPSGGTSSASQSQKDDGGFFSKVGDAWVGMQKAEAGIAAEAGKTLLGWADDIVNFTKKAISGSKPETEQQKAQAVQQRMTELKNSNMYKSASPEDKIKMEKYASEHSLKPMDGSPLDVGQGLSQIAKIVINSAIPESKKKSAINALTSSSDYIKEKIKKSEEFQKEVLPEDNIPTEVIKGIVGFAPELLAAAAMKNPEAVESRLASWAEKTTANASPFVKKMAPKAAKVLEESVKAPMTKIFAVKGALKAGAETKEGESQYWNTVEGALKGGAEGIYMHFLGEGANKVSPVIARQISKAGANSAVATAISSPLANAGVFTTAKALRTAAEEQRLITPKEAAMEAGTGIGFSLLHLGSQFDTHNEANHYYDEVLKTDPVNSLFRTINETKANLDLAYNPELTPEKIKELEDARDELKKAILKEPDLKTKKLLGDEAIKIQNQLDAHIAINDIVNHTEDILDGINKNDRISDADKKVLTAKVTAIADRYDNSEFGKKKRELSTKITETQKALSDAGEKFTNASDPVARSKAKLDVDTRRQELEQLNAQLTELIKNKQEEDAIQKQKSDEALLRAGDERLGLQEMGEGNAQPEVTTGEETITPEGAQKVENIAKDLGIKFREGGRVDEDGFVYYNEDNTFPIVDTFSKEMKDEYDNVVFENEEKTPEQFVADAYNKAKADGSNPELVKAVEDLLGAKAEPTAAEPAPEVKTAEPAPEVKTAEPTPEANSADIERRKKIGNLVIDYVWSRLAKQGITNADPIIGTRDTIENVDFDKFWSNVLPEDLQNSKDFFIREKEKQLKSFEKYKGEFDPTTGAFTSNDTSFYDNKIKDIDAELKYLEGKAKPEPTPEAKTAEPTPETKTALQQATEARKAAKERLKSLRQGMGISPEGKIEALVDYHRALVKEAKEFIKEKADDINEWAKSIGEKVNVALQKAWDEAKGTAKEVQTADELGYDFQDIFGEEVSKIPGYEETMKEIQDYADFSTRNKEYWEGQLEKAKNSGNKQKEQEAKAELSKYTEGNLDKAMEILEGSELYKSATDVQKEELVRDVRKRFELKEKKAPSPEELFGDVADASKVMEDINFLFDDANKSKEYLDEQYKKAKEAYDKNPTSQKLKENLDKAKAEVEEYKTKNIEEAIKRLKESEYYKKATPEQQAKMEKYLTDKFLKSQTSKILPTKLFGGAKEIKKITTTEKKAWKDQLSAFVRGIKNQAEATKAAMKEVRETISALVKKGNITTKQLDTIMNKMSTLKVFDAKSVDKFVDYVSKVFADAEYNDKLTKANGLKRAINKLASDETKDDNLTRMAKDFAKIKPSMVEDIDAYNDMAAKIRESLIGSKAGTKDNPLKIAEFVKISDVNKYTQKQLEAQQQAMYEQKLAELNELLDTDLSGLTFEELVELARSKKPIDKQKETIIRDAIKKMFDINASIIKRIFETGKDPFTDEEIKLSDEDKKLVRRFMGMDLNKLSIEESLQAMDSLSNFLRNESIAGMETSIRRYQANENLDILAEKGIKSKPLSFYGSELFGRTLGEQISTLPNLIESMFRSIGAASMFEKMSGISELKNSKTYVQFLSIKLSNEYYDKFYGKETNGKEFSESSNIAERGILADLKRMTPGTPEEQQAEFEKNKGLIEESIKELKLGNEKERELAKIYEEAYNKIAKDSKNIDEVISKSDKNNIDAVNFWIDKWASIYDKLSDVSESVYNKVLDRDLFYTPKRLSKLFNRGEAQTEEQLDESLFHNNNGTVYKEKTGVLQKAEKGPELPKNKNGQAKRFVDLSFDKNMANSMYDALMDIHTAGVIRQIEAFFKSPNIEKILPNPEDRAILYNDKNTGRVQEFIRAARNKEIINSDEADKLLKKLNIVSSIGTSAALGSVSNMFKQTIPVVANTFINAGTFDLSGLTNPAKADFMNRIGYGISIRGLESQGQISSINKLVDIGARSAGREALATVEKLSKFWLNTFLGKFDVMVARASWMTYYEKALRMQDIDPSTIDYSTHEVNEEAANYAQSMVDRQQNISDVDLQGKLLGSKDTKQKVVTSMLMPFSSFRLNQFMRAKSDISTIASKDPSVSYDDKVAAFWSLSGYAAEMLIFKALATYISLGIGTVANKYFLKKDETEEDYKKRKENLIRGQITGAITDVFSPIPTHVVDMAYANTADFALDKIQNILNVSDKDKYKLMTSSKYSDIQSLGALGFAAQRYMNYAEARNLANTGEFTDEYGRKKYISQKDREAMSLIAKTSLLSNFGLLPSEANSIVANAIKSAKKGASSKEGGQTEEDIQVEEMAKEQTELNKQETSKEREIKATVLDEMKSKESDQEKIDIMDRKIKEYLMTDEERKKYNESKKNERFYEKQKLEKLLGKYNSPSDMKRYDPTLYEERFGEGSDWYIQHNKEKEIEKELNDLLKKKRDEEFGYTETEEDGGVGFGKASFGKGGFGSAKFGKNKNK
jgi:hypothetical protein